MPVEVLTRSAKRTSRRMRRLGWTAAALLVLVGVTAVVTWRIRKDNQPEEYVPGEESRDITNVSADRGAARTSAPPSPEVKTTVTSRSVDRLLDPGKRLPSGAPPPLFTDVTKAAGLDGFRQFQGARSSQLPEDMGSGVAWGDFDNDGREDLFVVSGGGPLTAPASKL